jgi:hypothetical protein
VTAKNLVASAYRFAKRFTYGALAPPMTCPYSRFSMTTTAMRSTCGRAEVDAGPATGCGPGRDGEPAGAAQAASTTNTEMIHRRERIASIVPAKRRQALETAREITSRWISLVPSKIV